MAILSEGPLFLTAFVSLGLMFPFSALGKLVGDTIGLDEVIISQWKTASDYDYLNWNNGQITDKPQNPFFRTSIPEKDATFTTHTFTGSEFLSIVFALPPLFTTLACVVAIGNIQDSRDRRS